MQDQLFIRACDGMQPAPTTLERAPVIVEALARIDDAVLDQQDFDPATGEDHRAEPIRRIVLAPAIIARLGEVAPGIQLHLVPYGNDPIETDVISGTTAMVLGRIVDPPDDLVVRHPMGDGFACMALANHPSLGEGSSREQFVRLRHVDALPPDRRRAGPFQALERQGLRRGLAVSVTNIPPVPEMVAVTDCRATLPCPICHRMAHGRSLRVMPAPLALGIFPWGWRGMCAIATIRPLLAAGLYRCEPLSERRRRHPTPVAGRRL